MVKADVELLEVKIIILVCDSDIQVRMEVLRTKNILLKLGIFNSFVTQPHIPGIKL